MILFRAVFLELLHPFGMTLIVLGGLLLLESAYRLINLLVEGSINLIEAGTLLLFMMPQSLALVLPLAVVGGVFATVIRQSSESEVVALRACGISLWRYAAPFIAFGVFMTLLTLPVSTWLEPWAGRQYAEFQLEMVRWRADKRIVPGAFNTDFGGKVIHIQGREGETLKEIFIGEAKPDKRKNAQVITAEEGNIATDAGQGEVTLHLRNGQIVTHSPDLQVLRTAGFQSLRYVLDYAPAKAVTLNNLRTEPTLELWRMAGDKSVNGKVRRRARVEFFLRVAKPLACLAFALAAIPMALIDPRSGKRAGFLRAIFLVAAYNVVWLAFKDLLRSGKAPPEAIWLPSALIFSYGMLRLWQANADLDSWRQLFRRKRVAG